MKTSQKILGAALLILIAITAFLLLHLKAHQRLGDPGVKTRPLANNKNLEVLLPEAAPGYTSEILTNNEALLQVLPADTSFRVRAYLANDGFWSQVSVVLMGADRSSIHKPQICMTGQGWALDNSLARVEEVPMERPFAYALPINKVVGTKVITDAQGRTQTVSGIYLYWFVDGTHYTASSWRWMAWLLPRDLLLHGVLERWAYISYFSPCLPGQETATLDRMKKLIAATVPEFQLVPKVNSVN
jgi:hypothetical protein